MATAQLPPEFFDVVVHPLPPEQPVGPEGGRPRVGHRTWEEAGIWDRLHADLLGMLKRAGKLDLDTVIVDGVTVRAFGGGEATGSSPVDRRKPGSKHTVMVDKAGVPLVIRTAGAMDAWAALAASVICFRILNHDAM